MVLFGVPAALVLVTPGRFYLYKKEMQISLQLLL